MLTSLRGRGKTVLAKAFQLMIEDATAGRIQCTPDMMPSSITGSRTFNEQTRAFEVELSKAVTADVVLIDEVNRMMEECQAALMELLEEGQVTISGETYYVPEVNLRVLTRNPDGQAGTYRLADPTRDRILLDIDMNFPEADDLEAVIQDTELFYGHMDAKPVLTKQLILDARAYKNILVKRTPQIVSKYLYDLVLHTQIDRPEFKKLKLQADNAEEHDRLRGLVGQNIFDLGVLADGFSPRSLVGMRHAAAAIALIDGKADVDHEGAQTVFMANRHKLVMTNLAKSLNVKPEDIIKAALRAVGY
jgi:MoxR-like ATPase